MSEILTPRAATDVLSQTDFFSVLTDEQRASVSRICGRQDFPEAQPIYNHGEPAKYFYVLAEGTVRFAVGFGRRNASAGDMLRRDEFLDLMEQDNALGFQVMKQLNLLITGTLTAFAAG